MNHQGEAAGYKTHTECELGNLKSVAETQQTPHSNLPSLPLGENESNKGVPRQNAGAVWFFTKKEAS